MKSRKFVIFLLSTFLIFSGLAFAQTAQAVDGLKFSVTPNIPDNQYNKEVSYFDLLMNPGDEQEIAVLLKNPTDENVVILPQINSAMTNTGGVVEYSNHNNKERVYDKSLKHNIEDIVQLSEKEITLSPGEERELKLTITMPSEEFKGVIAGGIYLAQKGESSKNNDEKSSKETSTSLKNLYGYQIALLLRNNDELVTPKVVFEGAQADQLNVRNAVSLKVRNSTPTYINKVNYQAELKKKGSDEVIAKTDQKDMQFAPNTIFDLFVSMKGKQYEAGDYVLTGSIVSGNNKWPVNEEFTVTREQANKFNEADPDVEPESYTLVIILGAIVAVAVLVAIYLIRKNKQQKALLEKLKNEKK
ncbi:DUF916 and DUF3324 domain-containing protein [Enterococcus sp. AZ196]|uniref:DUF916 and DUF3324 domain-containing protein n=1 Tax=Enterococcus sp. AZ196 TaxID=2774659 RepID=UPI003D27346D